LNVLPAKILLENQLTTRLKILQLTVRKYC